MDRDEDDIDDRYYGKGLRKTSGLVQKHRRAAFKDSTVLAAFKGRVLTRENLPNHKFS